MNNPYLQHSMGFIMIHKGQFEKAFSYLKRAYELVERSSSMDFILCQHLHLNLGDLYQFAGDYATALSHYEKSIEFHRLSCNSNQFNLERIYYSTGLLYRIISKRLFKLGKRLFHPIIPKWL